MSRKDIKGRVLREGETQRSDGRYQYAYTVGGRRKFLYSWTLTAKDKTPEGKRKGPSLREKEEAVQKDIFDGLAPDERTVYQLAKAYTDTSTGVRETTKTGYRTVLNFLRKDEFGARRITDVKTVDAKRWLISLQRGQGKGYSSIHSIRGVLRPAFQMAEDDDLIRKNPFRFELSTVIVNDSARREALTREQERRFLHFVRYDDHYSRYYLDFLVLFKTGLRISEYCGLTLSDLDFAGGKIRVARQLQRTPDMRYYIEDPKTHCGTRFVPMTPEVKDALGRIVAERNSPRREREIDGVSGFLRLDKNGMPRVALHYDHYFKSATEAYNSLYKEELPKVTPHVCRHTFCTNMAKSGMNPKKLQYIMGHSDIGVTLNVYTHIGFDDVQEDMLKAAKIA